MPNTVQVVDWLTMEGLRVLVNSLQVSQFFNTDQNDEYTREFAVGETIRMPLPQRFLIRDGLGYSPQVINRIYTTVVCDQIFGVDFEWDSVEAALRLERGQERVKAQYLNPAMKQIAQEIDSRAALFAYQNTNNVVGQLGTDPTSFVTFNQARQRMVELACPPSNEKGMIIAPNINTSLVNAAIQYFNPASDISKQYKEGSIGRNSGFDWYESMSLYTHTAGVWATPGSVTVNTPPVNGATSMVVNCTSGDTFKKGDVFNIAGVAQVNPVTRRTTSGLTLKQFVITSAVTATAATATINFLPAIYGPGQQYQNVSALPLASGLLTLFPGTTAPSTGPKTGVQNLALHRDAFMMVGVKLETPKACEMSSIQRDPDSGIALRFIRMFDPQQSKMINRFDVLMGFGVGYADNCSVRVLGA